MAKKKKTLPKDFKKLIKAGDIVNTVRVRIVRIGKCK